MRLFYLAHPPDRIRQTVSGKLNPPSQLPNRQTPSGISEATSVEVGFNDLLTAFPLPWSAYVRLLSVRDESAREFYETEALRGGDPGALRSYALGCIGLPFPHTLPHIQRARIP